MENVDDVPPPEIEPPPPEPEEPEDLEISPPDVDALVVDPVDDPDDRPLLPDIDLLGLGGSSQGGHGYRSRTGADWGTPAGLGSLGDGASPFRGFLEDLRERGLDVVFVIDATGSMQRFIDEARAAIDDIIQDLATVVPSLRIGMVAYRDLGDDWTIRRAELTTDRYHIHTYLLALRAAGGRRLLPDFEEAVEEGLRVASEELTWRENARRVILLVGDAPYHDEDQSAALATVRSFGRGMHSLVNTLYVSAGGMNAPTANQQKAWEVFQRIATTGNGTAFELRVEGNEARSELRTSVTEATFGREWLDEIRQLQSSAPRDARRASVARHVERKDREWLIEKMALQPIHPAVTAACRELFDGRIAAAMMKQLESPGVDPGLRTAAHYVLQTSIAGLADIPFDASQPLAGQEIGLAAIRRAVREVPGAERHLDGTGVEVVAPEASPPKKPLPKKAAPPAPPGTQPPSGGPG